MSPPEREQRVQKAYAAVVSAPSQERERLLSRLDADLRLEVESLLAAEPSTLTQVFDESGPDANTLAPGSRIGHYVVEDRLGAGGMGDVFRALDSRLARRVAIKVCAQRFSSRFDHEARAISSLNHPH